MRMWIKSRKFRQNYQIIWKIKRHTKRSGTKFEISSKDQIFELYMHKLGKRNLRQYRKPDLWKYHRGPIHPSKARYTHTEMRIKQNPSQTRSEKKTTKHMIVKPLKYRNSKNIERYK